VALTRRRRREARREVLRINIEGGCRVSGLKRACAALRRREPPDVQRCSRSKPAPAEAVLDSGSRPQHRFDHRRAEEALRRYGAAADVGESKRATGPWPRRSEPTDRGLQTATPGARDTSGRELPDPMAMGVGRDRVLGEWHTGRSPGPHAMLRTRGELFPEQLSKLPTAKTRCGPSSRSDRWACSADERRDCPSGGNWKVCRLRMAAGRNW